MSYSANAFHNRSFLCACALPQGILKMTTMKVAGNPNTGFSFLQFEVVSSLGFFNSCFSSLQSPILLKTQNSGIDHVSRLNPTLSSVSPSGAEPGWVCLAGQGHFVLWPLDPTCIYLKSQKSAEGNQLLSL